MKLNDRITIERDDTSRADSGSKKPWTTAATVATVAAHGEPVEAGSREVFGNAEWTAAVGVYRWTIRYRSDVTTAMRVKFKSRYFNIKHVPALTKRQRYIGLLTEEIVG